jgi:hypothetical protein
MTEARTRFTYLLYVSRSGSTMLANHIASRLEGVLVFPELDFVGRLFAYGDDYVRRQSASTIEKIIHADTKSASLGLTEQCWNELVVSSLGQGINALLEALSKQYAAVRGQPPPSMALFQRGTLISVVPEIIACDPSAFFIHIYRDPRASINSVVKVRQTEFRDYDNQLMGRMDALGLSHNWSKYVRRVDHARGRWPGRILNVRYETYCADNDGQMCRIAEFLKAPLKQTGSGHAALSVAREEAELHRNIAEPPTTGRIDAWQEELTPWRGYIIERSTGELLMEKGYSEFFRPQTKSSAALTAYLTACMEWCVESIGPLRRRTGRLVREPRQTVRMLMRRWRDNH